MLPVNESMVQQEYGVVGGTLDWRHRAVHEDMQSVVHGAHPWHRHARLWTGKSCRKPDNQVRDKRKSKNDYDRSIGKEM